MLEIAIIKIAHADQIDEVSTSLLTDAGVKLQKPSELEPTSIRLTIGMEFGSIRFRQISM